MQRPFLKWAGGKARQVQHIIKFFPSDTTRLVEPFVGAGSVFLNSHYDEYWLNDINTDLINTFRDLKATPDTFIQDVKSFFSGKYNTEEIFYELRARFNQTNDIYERSILFVYLNRHCFNGLCRYNRQKHFNVPYGRFDQIYFPETEMRQFAEKLNQTNTILTNWDFSACFQGLRQNDMVYCDPPYVPLSRTANFTEYASFNFNLTTQRLLVALAEKARAQNITTLISNHDMDITRTLYKSAKISAVEEIRSISGRERGRKKAKELYAFFA